MAINATEQAQPRFLQILWLISIFVAFAEVFFGFTIAYFYERMDWLEWGLGSFAEGLSAVWAYNFSNKHGWFEDHSNCLENIIVTKRIGMLFYVMAAMGPMFWLLQSVGSGKFSEASPDSLETKELAGISVVIGGIIALFKWLATRQHRGGSLKADFKQALACALSGLIVLLVAYTYWYWHYGHIAGEFLIATILIYIGHQTRKHARFCC